MQGAILIDLDYPRALLFILCLTSVNFVTSQTYCQLPISQGRIQSAIQRNLEIIGAQGLVIDKDEIYLERVSMTCLASRGIDRYSSVTVVAKYMVTVMGINQTMQHQFQMSCHDGVWDFPSDESAFDMNAPPMPFEIPLEMQCSECTESLNALSMPYYDAKTNCNCEDFHMHTNVMLHLELSNCLPFFN